MTTKTPNREVVASPLEPPTPKDVADQQRAIRNLSARLRKIRKAKKAQQPNS
jgi:hypothetical protein